MKFNINDNGKLVECDIMFTFRDDSNNINYIIYTDGTKDEDGNDELLASRYVIEENNYILKDIENDYEWDLIDNYIESKIKKVD